MIPALDHADCAQPEPANTAQTHPSRHAPMCCSCAHQVLRGGIKPACNHPSQPVHLDDGEPWVPLLVARKDEARCQKEGLFFCGPSGAGFSPRSPEANSHAFLRAQALIASASEQLLKAADLLPEPARSTLLAAESSLQFLG